MSDIPKEIIDAYGDRDDFIGCEKRRAAIFGYHLRDKEVEELKKEIDIAKACWRGEMDDRIKKEQQLQNLKDGKQ